jgi:two-component sensor histidine kinase
MRRQEMSVQGQSERALGSFACQPATSFEHVGEGVVEVDMDGCIVLPNDTVMPLALIVNELVSSAVKRGIRNRISDKVRVSLTKERWPAVAIDRRRRRALRFGCVRRRCSGRQLVIVLARQLQDSFEVTRNPSTARLRFPASGI